MDSSPRGQIGKVTNGLGTDGQHEIQWKWFHCTPTKFLWVGSQDLFHEIVFWQMTESYPIYVNRDCMIRHGLIHTPKRIILDRNQFLYQLSRSTKVGFSLYFDY